MRIAGILAAALLKEVAAASWWKAEPGPDISRAVPEDAGPDLALLREDAKEADSKDSLTEAVAHRIGENADNDDFLPSLHSS
eukprot:g27101.t1